MQRTILLIDDDERITATLKTAFRHEKFRVLTAACAKDALELLADEDVDLVVSDECMPGMCGTDLLVLVAQHHPEIIRIMLTGNEVMLRTSRVINEARVAYVLTKPCETAVLARIIREGLEALDNNDPSNNVVRVYDALGNLLATTSLNSPEDSLRTIRRELVRRSEANYTPTEDEVTGRPERDASPR